MTRSKLKANGGASPRKKRSKRPPSAQFDAQGSAYYATARLWDDGIVDPAQTRRTLGLGLAAAANAPVADTRFGVFRM